jgi:hypothetical protein
MLDSYLSLSREILVTVKRALDLSGKIDGFDTSTILERSSGFKSRCIWPPAIWLKRYL